MSHCRTLHIPRASHRWRSCAALLQNGAVRPATRAMPSLTSCPQSQAAPSLTTARRAACRASRSARACRCSRLARPRSPPQALRNGCRLCTSRARRPSLSRAETRRGAGGTWRERPRAGVAVACSCGIRRDAGDAGAAPQGGSPREQRAGDALRGCRARARRARRALR